MRESYSKRNYKFTTDCELRIQCLVSKLQQIHIKTNVVGLNICTGKLNEHLCAELYLESQTPLH